MNPRHASFEIAIAQAQARGLQCEVDGCWKPREDFGRYCGAHRQHRDRHGHPTERDLPRKWIGGLIVLGQRYVKQIDALPDHHPARQQLALARHWLTTNFANANGYEGVSFRAGQSYAVKWYRHLATIGRHGTTVDKVLALVIAYYIAREWYPGRAAASDEHERHQIARLVLHSVVPRLPAWRRTHTPEALGFRFGQWAGRRLQENIGLFCGLSAGAILGDARAGYPRLEDQRPVSKTAAMKASRRPRFKPLGESDD